MAPIYFWNNICVFFNFVFCCRYVDYILITIVTCLNKILYCFFSRSSWNITSRCVVIEKDSDEYGANPARNTNPGQKN